MASYSGVPSIRLEGDKEAALALIPEAKVLLQKTQAVRDRAGVSTYSMAYRVNDRSTIYVLCSGGQNILNISVEPDVPEQTYPEGPIPEGTKFPDLYSGVVIGGIIEERTAKGPDGKDVRFSVCANFAPTPTCVDTHKELTSGRQPSKRLVVRPWAAFDELQNRSETRIPEFTQYALLRSSMYSGTMKQVVQTVMGLGRTDIKTLKTSSSKEVPTPPRDRTGSSGSVTSGGSSEPPDSGQWGGGEPPKNPTSQEITWRATSIGANSGSSGGSPSSSGGLPDPNKQKITENYTEDVKALGVQIRYDWRFIRTHGITKAADGRLWLIEISLQRGVLARLLPIFPYSNTESFRRRVEGSKDSAMLTVLEELGCLPTGETFPIKVETLDEKIKSGEILRLLTAQDLSDFYKCSPYSSSMGWAFNDSGSEAHNTAYYFDKDGFQHGVWYQVNLKIGAIKEKREKGTPIADASANMRRIYDGFIYCPPVISTSPARFVPIKFFEPMLPGLVSHEGVPSIEAAGKPIPKVDTPMFVSFINGDLKVVRYFRNPKQEIYNSRDGDPYPGECLLASTWSITETSGIRSFPTMMYTNDFDHRKTLQENTTVTDIDSYDLGYDPPRFSDFVSSPEAAYVWRERIFRRTTTVSNRGGEQVVAAVAIPQFSREAYYYATGREYSTGHSGSTTISYDAVKDPNVGYAWRCFPRINPPPFPPGRPDCNTSVCRGSASCSSGGVGYHKERRIVCTAYEPGSGGSWVANGGAGDACHEFADSGTWLEICQNVDNFNQRGVDRTGSTVSWNKGGDAEASLYLVSPGHGGPLKIPINPDHVFNHWMNPSPDPIDGSVQFIYAEHSAIGSDALVYATGLSVSSDVEIKLYGYSPEPLTQRDGFPAFIGVNKP